MVLKESASVPPNEDGSGGNSTHRGSGRLTRRGAEYVGRIEFTESSQEKDRSLIPMTVTMNGTESWELSLALTGSTYRLSVDHTSASGTVARIVTADNTGEKDYSTSFVPWGIFSVVDGDLPAEAGEISGQVTGDAENDGCNGSLEFTLTPEDTLAGGGGGPAPSPKKPKKQRKLPVIPELLPKLLSGVATSADGKAYATACAKMGCQRCVIDWYNRWHRTPLADITKAAWAELDLVNDPEYRVDDYLCTDHQVPLRAGIALYWSADASVAGHTAWAIEMPPELYAFYKPSRRAEGPWVVGSYAEQNGMPVGPGKLDVFSPTSPQERFRDEDYIAYKASRAKVGYFEAALVRACYYTDAYYRLLGQNCADACWIILSEFGVPLLPVGFGVSPYIWFKEMPETDTILRKVSSQEQAQMDAAAAAAEAGDGGQTAALAERPKKIEAVYQARSGGAVHLSRDCPALAGKAKSVRTLPLAAFRSPEAVEAEFNSPVCGTCMRQLRAEANVRYRADCLGDQTVRLYPDCLAVDYPPKGWSNTPGLLEVPLTDVTGRHHGFKLPFTSGLPLVIEYELDLEDGRKTGTKLELKFETEQGRADFEQALDEMIELIG